MVTYGRQYNGTARGRKRPFGRGGITGTSGLTGYIKKLLQSVSITHYSYTEVASCYIKSHSGCPVTLDCPRSYR